MTTVKQYATSIRAVARNVSRSLGEDIGIQDKSMRVTLNLILGMVCVLIKLLVDKGLITDADVTTAFTSFNNDPTAYPDVPDPAPVNSGLAPVVMASPATAGGTGTAQDATVGP